MWRRNTLSFKNRFKETVNVPIDYQESMYKWGGETYHFTIGQSEDPDSTLWDASVVLSRYLCSLIPGSLKNKRVIELGAGCGLVGMVAAKLGANASITDLPEYIPLLDKNIIINKEVIGIEGSVVAETLDWGNLSEINSKFNPPVDYIVGSDIVYALQGFEELVKTMDCLSNDETKILIAYEHRFYKFQCAINTQQSWKDVEGYFNEVAEKHFIISHIPFEDPDERFRLPNIKIFNLQKKE